MDDAEYDETSNVMKETIFQEEESPKITTMSSLKLIVASVLLLSAGYNYSHRISTAVMHGSMDSETISSQQRRRLKEIISDGSIPQYMGELMDDLKSRKKLMEDTPPEEVKYWFEYAGPLQKYYYRFSKTRGKADSFEGRDDSGVVSSRFMDRPGGGKEFENFYINSNEATSDTRLFDNCLAMGNKVRPDFGGSSYWSELFSSKNIGLSDRCRVLIVLNTVGAGRGSTILWETKPPAIHASMPKPWVSEQETAFTHLERNLKEVDAMCATGQIAARIQILVCEPIPGKWTDWMDSMLPNCGGKPAPFTKGSDDTSPDHDIEVEERPSPVQVVVVSSADMADTCHDLKSGFMEKRMQDLILAPPYLTKNGKSEDLKVVNTDPTVKTTHRDLVSSDDHDVYIAMKWSSLVTVRGLSAFLQASADIAAAAASPVNQEITDLEKNADGAVVALNLPSSPFLIPSFLRVSYVSEENSKVAKWRMHGDFFHPAAWEICKDSFDMTWIPHSLSGSGGVNGICYDDPGHTATSRRLDDGVDCGQWWIYMAEEQMSTSPEVHASENSPPLVQGGSTFFWMITERQRKEIVKIKVCEHAADKAKGAVEECGENPQAVIPLGDMESFQINFTPNTALGKGHVKGRTPGYSRQQEHERDRKLVRERKQLKDQEDIEKALFDYTIYPAALFRKDATKKATRIRDHVLTKEKDISIEEIGPQSVKSSYYDVTITKPREATLGWCQAIARKGLCVLYAEYFRLSPDKRCMEACGLKRNWTKVKN